MVVVVAREEKIIVVMSWQKISRILEYCLYSTVPRVWYGTIPVCAAAHDDDKCNVCPSVPKGVNYYFLSHCRKCVTHIVAANNHLQLINLLK
jgi:hypothetical protein